MKKRLPLLLLAPFVCIASPSKQLKTIPSINLEILKLDIKNANTHLQNNNILLFPPVETTPRLIKVSLQLGESNQPQPENGAVETENINSLSAQSYSDEAHKPEIDFKNLDQLESLGIKQQPKLEDLNNTNIDINLGAEVMLPNTDGPESIPLQNPLSQTAPVETLIPNAEQHENVEAMDLIPAKIVKKEKKIVSVPKVEVPLTAPVEVSKYFHLPPSVLKTQDIFLSTVKQAHLYLGEQKQIETHVAENAKEVVFLYPQYFLVADSAKLGQRMYLFFTDMKSFYMLGSSPISTGQPGQFDHFYTPEGWFINTVDHFSYRAEGTKNSKGIRGYGKKGSRVWDFGWQQSKRGWGAGDISEMRFLMHATDPDYLEQRLGKWNSKGCLRIHQTMNRFVDHYGIIDLNYEKAHAEKESWILNKNREPVEFQGSMLLVINYGVHMDNFVPMIPSNIATSSTPSE